jgi:hypothetical protein
VNSCMQHHSSAADETHLWSSDDELGQLIRWSLKDHIGAAEPASEVWLRILDRVQEERASTSARSSSKRSSAPLASLVQAAVIGCVLLTLGLGADRDVILARRQERVHSAPSVQNALVFEEVPEDILPAEVPPQMEQEAPFRRGGDIREAAFPI